MPTQFTFDGHGINDAGNEHKPRLATLTKEGHALKVGPLLAASPDMLAALEFVLSHTNAKNQFGPTLSMQAAGRAWDNFLKMARKVVKEAKA